MIEYAGYKARVSHDGKRKTFICEVVNSSDMISFEGTSQTELEENFVVAIDEYTTLCKQLGKKASKDFSGKVLVRMSPELHERAIFEAVKEDRSLNSWILKVLERETKES